VTARARGASGKELGSRFETPELSPGFLLWRVATRWQRQIRAALEPLDLTHAQFVLLATASWLGLGDTGAITQAVIAEHAGTDAVMTSEVLRTLERRRLVKRLPHPIDARAKQIVVTAAGRSLAEKAIAIVEQVDATFFDAPTPEMRALARAMSRR
jgi:DNA-binding MarR family transcriptional regulator